MFVNYFSQQMTYHVLFFIRKEKINKLTGLAPLYLRITCGKRKEISLNKWVSPQKWNADKQCLVGNSPEAKAINALINTLIVKLHEHHRNLLDKGEVITAEALKNCLQGKGEQQKTILEVFDYVNNERQKQEGRNYSSATIRKYGYCKQHLESFIWYKHNNSDIYLSKVDAYFVREFMSFLTNTVAYTDVNGKKVVKERIFISYFHVQ